MESSETTSLAAGLPPVLPQSTVVLTVIASALPKHLFPELCYHIFLTKMFKVDFWIKPSVPGRPVHIFVGPEEIPSVESYIADIGLISEVLISDAEK